jgi:hypothetical protein
VSAQLDWFMTEAEAHKIVARWQRFLLPCRARTEAQAVRNMERGSMGLVGGGVLICVTGCTALQGALFWIVTSFGLVLSGFALSLMFRFREARHALHQADLTNRRSQI